MSNSDNPEQILDNDSYESLDRHAVQRSNEDARSTLIEGIPEIYMRGAIYVFFVVVFAVLVISYFSKVSVIVPVRGMIIPEGQNKVVEALSAGIVSEIKIKEGDQVSAGQTILLLREDASSIDLQAMSDGLSIGKKKLEGATRAYEVVKNLLDHPEEAYTKKIEAFVDAGSAMNFVGNLLQTARALRKAETEGKQNFLQKVKLMETQMELAKADKQRQREAQKIAEETLPNLREVLKRKQEEFKQTETLYEKRIVNINQLNAARDAITQAKGVVDNRLKKISEIKIAVSRAEIGLTNQRIGIDKAKSDYEAALEKAQVAYRSATAALATSLPSYEQTISQLQASIAKTTGDLALKERAIGQLKVTSPVKGTVIALNYTSPGQKVGSGSQVAMVVPENEKPVVVAQVPNKHVGSIKPGISAKVKVDAFPYRQFGTVPGTVLSVFPVAGKPLFTVRVALDAQTIKVGEEMRPLKPGLTVNADLVTKRRRILSMLFKKM